MSFVAELSFHPTTELRFIPFGGFCLPEIVFGDIVATEEIPMHHRYYVQDVSGGRVREVLNHAENETQEKIIAHPGMKCRNRGHREVELPLYEVSRRVLDKLISQKYNDGLLFVVFVQTGDNLPQEQSIEIPRTVDPFKAGRRQRLATPLPRGVFRGSRLIAKSGAR